MERLFLKRSFMRLMMLVAVLIVAAPGLSADVYAETTQQDFPMTTPMWEGPYDIFIRPDLNVAYPDTGAVYWSSKITIPAGAELELVGKYAHARYMSINSYNLVTGAPTDALADVQIVPDEGSENPFMPGAKRATDRNRNFTITILNELPPEDPSQRMPNTLYAKAGDDGTLVLAWRIYVTDKNRDITGGVGLPEPHVILASGEVLDTTASYAALSIDNSPLPATTMGPMRYYSLREGLVLKSFGWPYPIPATFPSSNPPVFKKVFNVTESVSCTFINQFLGKCNPAPAYQVGQYANLDNQYMSTNVNRGYGELLVIRGKAPVTPATYQRVPYMQDGVDMRYWSITVNESMATTKVVTGTYDEQTPLDDNGYYTIVVSRPEDRPANSHERNGVKWMEWSPNGDGAVYPVNHPNDATIIFRNMLPSPDFGHAIQDVEFPGQEAEVLGPYMPVCQYMSVEEFEALGLRPWKNM
ncbi:MAG: hypothetical protein C0403_08385 [Desulfobacterium sp.]|nr:hypothetical protein [Desulfobacterium sp.]